MPGMMKKKYYSENTNYTKSFTKPLSLIAQILPYNYGKESILDLFIKFYPCEWNKLVQRYNYYHEKDMFLKRVGKKIRYNHLPPTQFFYNLAKVKHLVSCGQINKHNINFNSERQNILYETFTETRRNKIAAYTHKIEKAKENLQKIDPLYIDVFISAFHKKNCTTKEKIEIFKEITKYYSDKTITFFQKINDSERNNQVRRMAFVHLQDIGVYVRLRKNFKGKKKNYMLEENDFNVSPKDLVERIESDSFQNKKIFDVFISHSYLDSELVRIIKDELNKNNITIYCDWTSDNDFLRRKLASEYTRIVLKKRIEQSKVILLLQTENSISHDNHYLSEWIKMEINHAIYLSKPIYCINLTNTTSVFKDIPFIYTDNKISISPMDIGI
ncbi:toll/interleukin-1 receptor domain-containing protein [Pectobacterium parmentieri]|uniref:TIR domain-containing protein n=1 Tax=Pectobacterium parmentieri TaxID=1905730 RepID=UPI001373E890|nr:TIR domain-containing protein [Pectobacterium parmentieri]QHQ18556.1 toll/interleukin-1 receptor domain-containing protein [Pectobacterium parmentieri]QQA76810.1 toll/interleukin-1 receptor domain-containing protein [Pectobacterium parmentieri]